ncbi:MAG TPA: hypothetical protein VGY53_08975 [Isosphaeraceae bacterium]|nr:hypothetical protein [Isosphaeraceae bacterium]
MAAAELLRLAWLAAREGRVGTRDSLLTLALAESGPADAAWATRCWRRLLTLRADHIYARFPTLEKALADERVAGVVLRLRAVYPPARVQRLLERAAVLRGTYTGRRASLAVVLDELLGAEESRPGRLPDASLPAPYLPREGQGAASKRSAKAAAAAESREPLDPEIQTFYLTVLLAIAMLLATTQRASGQGSNRAA